MSKRRTGFSVVISTIVTFFMGIFIGFQSIYMMTNHFENDSLLNYALSFFIVLIIFIISAYIQIVIHELGHLVFGLATGYKFMSFRVGSMTFIKENKKFKVKRMKILGTGGQCLLAPPDLIDNKIPYFWYNAGGVVFNLISIPIFGTLYLLFKDIFMINTFLFCLVILGITFAINNGIPMQLPAIDNDAQNILTLKRNPQCIKYFWIVLNFTNMITQGKSIKDIDKSWFEIEENAPINPFTNSIKTLKINYFLDQYDFKKAKFLTKEMLENENLLTQLEYISINSELIYCILVTDENYNIDELYSKKYKKLEKAMQSLISIIRVQYAYELLYKNDLEKANKKKEFFEKVCKVHPLKADVEIEQNLLDYATKIYEQRKLAIVTQTTP